MSIEIKRRRGTTAQHAVFVGKEAELTVDMDKHTVVVHDGVTPGGHPLARVADMTTGVMEAKTYTDAKTEEVSNKLPIPNYDYAGKNLKDIFGTAAAFRAAVATGDFSRIRIGDYWPISLTGTYRDYAVDTDKTFNNAVLLMEVAGINIYWRYGDTALSAPHVLLCPRDCLPNTAQMRSENSTWYTTDTNNPWLGSRMYQTLNAADGILPLIAATDIGAYIYAGPNNKGMRAFLPEMAQGSSSTTTWSWMDRGRIFLPMEREVWGSAVNQVNALHAGLALQWPIFIGTLKHISKCLSPLTKCQRAIFI